jgi:inositol 2-dehydrogenase
MRSNPSRVRAALIGAGRMAQTHARALAAVPALELRAVCDTVPENATRLAKTLSAAATTFEAALADPDIDAVIIATPTPTHAALIRQAAGAGKHIFVEKPVAGTLAEAGEVVREVKQAGVQCQVGFQRRFDPAYVEAKRSLDAGELGKIATFRGVSRDPTPPPLEFLETSGGLMVDLGVHDLDTMRFLVGEVAEVRAVGAVQRLPKLAEFGLFDSAVATVRFENGALGTLELGLHTAYGYEIRAEILGEKGRLHLEMTSPLHLTRYTADGAVRKGPQNFEERFLEAYTDEFRAFAACLLENRPVAPDAEDAAKTLRLALAAQHALTTGQTVHVPSFAEKDKVTA